MNEQSESQRRDVIIIGGGVAGLSAALTLGRACRTVLVLDAGEPRNRFAPHMYGVLGHDGIDPAQLVRQGREEAAAYDVVVRPAAVARVEDADGGITVALQDGGTLSARMVVVATGLTDDLPDIPGLAQQWGTGVLHCPYCHGWEVRGHRLGVLGTSPMSLHQAELIRQWSDRLTFFSAGCGPLEEEYVARLRARSVEVIDSPVTEVTSREGRLTGVQLADGTQREVDAIFAAPTLRPHDDFLSGLGLARAENPMGSFLEVDGTGKTSHPRIWAIGNVANPGANVPISIGAGSTAGGVVNLALVAEDFDRAVEGGEQGSAAAYWESDYADQPRRWSGRVNPTMADVVTHLPIDHPGHALDLGCGEGGDAVWLAEQGWQVTAVDISATATARGAEHAQERGVSDRITWVNQDLTDWASTQTFDLVTASFFHSTVGLSRTQILRRAADRLRPGGHLLIVSHVFESAADVPPWARHHHVPDPQDQAHTPLTPAEELAALALDEGEWEVVVEEVRGREATGPDGQEVATVKDGILLQRRKTAGRRSVTAE